MPKSNALWVGTPRPDPTPDIRGQVVPEGVAVRARGCFAVAVRRPTGEIIVREQALGPRYVARGWARLPILRGLFALWVGLRLQGRALVFAAAQAGLNGPLACAMVGFQGARRARRWSAWQHLIATRSMYRGAWHKALAALQAGAPLELPHARRFALLNPRAGAVWASWVALLAAAGLMLGVYGGSAWRGALVAPWLVAVQRVGVLALTVGLGYELTHWSAARLHRPWVRALSAPALLVARLTVREPTPRILEVALVALRAALSRDSRVPAESARARPSWPRLVGACARSNARPQTPAAARVQVRLRAWSPARRIGQGQA
jgi:uncharacterized protein YqhQ